MFRWFALFLGALAGCAAPLAGTPQGGPPQAPAEAPLPVAPLAPVAPPVDVAPAPEAAVPQPATAADDEAAALDDDDDAPAPSGKVPADSPAVVWSDGEIDRRFHHELASIGPASVGPPSAGALVNGVQMPAGEHWRLTDPGRAWGTQESVDALTHCIERVNQRFPGAPPISIGHLSAKNGGHLSPHRSHQSGRDADVGYYYKAGARPFVRATADNLDLPRTWALVKAALRETTVEMIFIDHSVQGILAAYAAESGEDAAFLDEVFQVRGKNARAPIRHIRGHDNHIHFRWNNPVAEAMGRRVARFVVIPRAPRAAPGVRIAASQPSDPLRAGTAGYAQIRARSGDTLVILARRYGTTVEEIQRANGLAGNGIRAGVVYRIPQKAPLAAKAGPAHGPKGPARVASRKAPAKPVLHTPGAKARTSAPDR